jgi:hypothetical protein
MLQKFQFKDEADRIQAEVGAGSFEDGRAAHVGPDDFFYCGDLLAIYGGFGHRGKTLRLTSSQAGAQRSLGCARDKAAPLLAMLL